MTKDIGQELADVYRALGAHDLKHRLDLALWDRIMDVLQEAEAEIERLKLKEK